MPSDPGQIRPAPTEGVLVVNVHSRKGEKLFDEVCSQLRIAGVRLSEAHAVHDPDDFVPTVKRAVENGAPMIIVGGGDGSLSSAIDEFVGHDSVFALLPLGTANSFARTLGIPLDLEGAIRTITTGRRRRVDLGVINGDYFVNAAALGLSPLIGDTVPHKLKRYLGRLGYLIWAVWCLMRFRPFRLKVDNNGQNTTIWATEVRILNGRFHGGVEIENGGAIFDHGSGGIVLLRAA